MRTLSAAFCVSLACAVALSANASPRYRGSFKVDSAAFSNFATINSAPGLVIAGFTGNPFGKDGIYVVDNIGKDILHPQLTNVTTATHNITWPNDIYVSTTPNTPLGDKLALVVPYGFLVPPKTVGGVKLMTLGSNLEVEQEFKMTKDKGSVLDGWFYHQAIWYDMNGDGRQDLLTARATKPIFGAEGGEMVWLEQPASDPLGAASLPWQEHVIASGNLSPDVFFRLHDVNGDGFDEILFTSFFSGGGFAVMYSNSTAANRWDNSTGDVGIVLVDGSIGPCFGLELSDLNNDGALDVLVTNHVNNASDPGRVSGVWAYEMPRGKFGFLNPAAWTRHNVTTGFVIREGGPGQAAPGAAIPFQPITGGKGKPSIVIAGDGDQRLYVAEPLTESPMDWRYNRTMIYDCKGTVGKQSVGDVNGDGYADILCPCYDDSYIAVLAYGP